MKKYLCIVTLLTGFTFTQHCEGRNKDDAMLDACWKLADSDYPEDMIADVDVTEIVED